MKNTKITLQSFLILSILLMVSCRPKPLDIELEQAETKLVINSQFVPIGNTVVVVVSKSFSALANTDEGDEETGVSIEDYLVAGAEVTISYNGETKTLMQNDTAAGFYLGMNISQEVGTEYELYVNDPSSKLSVRATTSLLKTIPLDTVRAIRTFGEFSDTIVKMHIAFDDPIDEQNWYMVNFYGIDRDTSTVDTAQMNPFLNRSSRTFTGIFSDEMYADSHISIDYEMWWYADTITASFYNISEEYYEYLEARNKGGSLLSMITSEPINHPTNVIGGYGFFNAHFPDVKIVFTEE